MITFLEHDENFEVAFNGEGVGIFINKQVLLGFMISEPDGLEYALSTTGELIHQELKATFDDKQLTPMFGGVFEGRTRLELSIALSKVANRLTHVHGPGCSHSKDG